MEVIIKTEKYILSKEEGKVFLSDTHKSFSVCLDAVLESLVDTYGDACEDAAYEAVNCHQW